MRPLFCFLLALVSIPAFADERPNAIIFMADDVSWNDFGCYGNEAARTPNIDKLAADGIRFDQAFLTASSCSPSRSSIVTGRYPHNNGPGSELHQPISGHLAWFPGLLREAGYHTVVSGKDHMTRTDGVKIDAWDQISNGRSKENSGGHAHWIRDLENAPADKPFFGWYAAYDAHRNWDGDGQWDAEKYGPKHDPADVIVPPFLVDDEKTREDLASYYNEVTRFDWFIGATIEELKKQGRFENTLIFVLADNGRPFPRAKTRLHDSGMKTALVAHWPKGIKNPGTATGSLASVIDLAPTILRSAGVEPAESMQGVDLSPIFADRMAAVRRYVFSEHNWHDYEAHGRSVRDTEGWLYITNNRPDFAQQGPADSVRSLSHKSLQAKRDANALNDAQADVFAAPRPLRELYFSPDDPHQLKNLAEVAQFSEIQDQLAKVLDQWIEQTGDTVPEKIRPDMFDRETGDSLGLGKKGGPDAGWTPPGTERDASKINAPGPQ